MLALDNDEVLVAGGPPERRLRYEKRVGLDLHCAGWGVLTSPWQVTVHVGTLHSRGVIVPNFTLVTAEFDWLTTIPNGQEIYQLWLEAVGDEKRQGYVRSFRREVLRFLQQFRQLKVEFVFQSGKESFFWVYLDTRRVPGRLPRRFSEERFFYDRITADD